MQKTRRMREVEERLGEPLEIVLRRMYITEKKSSNQIKDILGVQGDTILGWLHYFDITIRRRSEAGAVASFTYGKKTKLMCTIEKKLGEPLELFLKRKHCKEGWSKQKI